MSQAQLSSAQSDPLFHRLQRLLGQRPFQPPLSLSSGYLQTMAADVLKRDFPWGWESLQAYFFDLSDGSRIRADCVWQSRSAPTLLAVHGMGGSSTSTYMLGLSHKAHRQGWNAVLLNLYNCNLDLPRPKIFHAGASREVGEIIETVLTEHNIDQLFIAGMSMGGNILLKLMGEWGENRPVQVQAAAVISPLVDLTVSWQVLERPSNFIFQRHFIRKFKRLIEDHHAELASFVDIGALQKIKTIREFDELLTAPLGGFNDASEYYREASSAAHLEYIRVPTFMVHSRDDPLLPWEPLVQLEVRSNPHLLVHLTQRGGHGAFLERNPREDVDRRWAENRTIDFFRLAASGSG